MSLLRKFFVVVTAMLLTTLVSARIAAAADEAGTHVEHSHANGAHSGIAHAEEEPALLQAPKQGMITAITTLVIFVALVAVLGKFAWGPIASGLQAREDKIRKDIADAEASRAKAEASLKEYTRQLAAAQDQIRQMLGQAQKDAEGVAAGIKVKAQQEAEEAKERAVRDIDASKNAAIAEIHDHAATLATAVAAKILRRNINEADQRDLVKGSLEQLQTLARN